MKTLLHIAFLLSACSVVAQSGFYNDGNIKVFGNLGIHTNFINDADFDQDRGLVGFYGNSVIQISGDVEPILWDTEIMVTSDLFMHNSVHVKNNVNFISTAITAIFSSRNDIPPCKQKSSRTLMNGCLIG